MSTGVVEGHTVGGAGSEEQTQEDTIIGDNVGSDELPSETNDGNRFQQAITAWRSMSCLIGVIDDPDMQLKSHRP